MAQVVWITQDNYSHWRYALRDGNVQVGTASRPYALRAECEADAARAFPDAEIHVDGVTAGRDEPPAPLPTVDPELEAAAGGYVIP